MQIGPACYSVAPARTISVNGIWFPYQNDLVVAREQEVFAASPEEFVVSEELNGRRLFTMPPLSDETWMVLDIRPVGTRFKLAGVETTVANVSSGLKWTPARARITWTEQGGVVQTVDVDIGAGVSFEVPPTNQVSVDLLVANPATLDDIPIPVTVTREQLKAITYSTTVTCKATCVSSPTGNDACLTRLIYMGDTDGGRTTQQVVMVPNGARGVEMDIGQIGSAGPGADGQWTSLDFLLRWETQFLPSSIPTFEQILGDAVFDIFPSARFQLAGDPVAKPKWNTGLVVYPGNFNAIRARLTHADLNGTFNFKFFLDV